MAAIKKVRKNTEKNFQVKELNPLAITFEEINTGNKFKIKTACKTFGKVILNKSFNLTQKKCKDCASEIKVACLSRSKYAKIEPAKEATRGTNVDKYNVVFDLLHSGLSSKDVQKQLSADFSSEGACKSFISTCSAALNAVKNPTGKSKMSVYARFLGSTAKNPKTSVKILPKSKRFTEVAFRFVASLEKAPQV